MRIWSLHPAQLDRLALVACWREALLAQAVLAGRTKGYRHHPQLTRWRSLEDPVAGIAAYLGRLADEADSRGYRFDRDRIDRVGGSAGLTVTAGQLDHEWHHLRAKVMDRDPQWWERICDAEARPHPCFTVVPGAIEAWEVR